MNDLINHHEGMSGAMRPEHVKITALNDICSNELNDFMELKHKDLDYRTIGETILNFVDRKGNTPKTQVHAKAST